MRERISDNMKLSQGCDRVEAMVQAACDRVWEAQRIFLTARPGHPLQDKDEEIVNHCHEVLFGGNEERQKSIIKLILQYLI